MHVLTYQLESLALLVIWSTLSIQKEWIWRNMQRLADPLAHLSQHFQSGPSRLALNSVCFFLILIRIPFRKPTVTLANRAEPGSLRKRWNFHLRLSAKSTLLYFRPNSDLFRTRSGAVCRPCTINVRNDPVQEMFCVVKCETPPVLRWKLYVCRNFSCITI